MDVQDIQAGRRMISLQQFVTGTNGASVPLVGPNPKRTSLTITTNQVGAAQLWVTFGAQGIAGQGFRLVANDPNYTFTLDTIGQLITQPVFVFSDGSASIVSYIETMLE